MFDEKKAEDAIKFISNLKHTKGQWAGVKWNWIPWQVDATKQIFGTVDENGFRQYRIVYIELPKKSGKSEYGAAIALKCLAADGEAGAEVYGAAGDRDQAGIVFNVAKDMVELNPTLRKKIKVIDSTKRMIYGTSIYRALSSEAYTKHGYNPSAVVFDELHAQPNRQLYDVLVEGTDTARQQQLILIITTAGIHDQESIGWQVHDYALKVKNGIIDDPTFLPIIWQAEDEDDWQDPEVWKKVNPSLGYIFEIDKIEKHYNAVKNDPARINNFRRYRLNQWVGQISRYIPMEHWDACDGEVPVDKLKFRPCYAGLDLSSTMDLTCLCVVFPPRAGVIEPWYILPYFFCPEESIRERAKSDRAPYDMWARAGLITATPGNAIDYQFIRKKVIEISNLYDLKEVAYDPWGSTQIAIQLSEDDGIPMLQHRQGYKTMSPATKETLKRILSHELAHGGHPVLRWCVDNLAVTIDAAENVKPAKDKSSGRIDGVVAMIMAIGNAFMDNTSLYESRPNVISF